MKFNTVIQGDCLKVLKQLPDNAVDLVLTDPPYGLNIAKTGRIGKGKRFTPKAWDIAIPTKEYFDEMRRVSRNQIIWGGNHFTQHLPSSRGWLVWWKKDGLPRNNFSDCELAWTSFDVPAKVYNSRWYGFIRDSKEPRVAHPTQKALDVMRWCIESFSDPEELILDPFMGSGTSCVAAEMTGRRYIGIESDEEYIAIAGKRIAEVASEIPPSKKDVA